MRGQEVIMRSIGVQFSYKTQWLCQTVRLDANVGLYDYLRGRVRLAPGQNTYTIAGIDWDTATPCEPPESTTFTAAGLAPGEMNVAIIMHEGIDVAASPEIPELDRYINPDDLSTDISKNIV